MNIPGRDDDRVADLAATFESVPWAGGVLAGVATFLGSYLAVFALIVATGTVDTRQSIGAVLRSVGYVMYNALNVPTYERRRQSISQDGSTVGEAISEVWRNQITGWRRIRERVVVDGEVVQESTRSAVEQTAPTLPPLVYLAVPVVVLVVAAGVFTYARVDLERVDSPADALVVSVAVAAAFTLGYLLCVLVGTYALAVQGSGGAAVLHPARPEALGYGLAYPFVTVAVSAGLMVGWRRERETSADQSPAE